MSGVYIKGFRLPEKSDLYYVNVECEPGKNPVATIWRKDVLGSMSFGVFECIPVPDHGGLIDPQWVKDKMVGTLEVLRKVFPPGDQERHLISAIHMVGEMLDDAPTIVPADKE